jgi:hypothetical protein
VQQGHALGALGPGGRAESIHRGEQDQRVRLDQQADQGGQQVVVAELDFFRGHHVVLVHDGDDAVPQQVRHGVARIQVAGAMAQVVVGEEDLADAKAFLR